MDTLTHKLAKLVACPSFTKDREVCKQLLRDCANELSDPHWSRDHETLWWGHSDLKTTKWLINTHIDVVPCHKDQLKFRTKGDRAWGRGVADVKACAAIILNNAKKWDSIAKRKKITFMLVSDEEIGGHSTKKILPTMLALAGGIFLEPTNLRLTTEAKGMMQIRIRAIGASCHGSRPWDGKNAIEQLARGLVQFRLTHPSPLQETRETTFNFSQIKGGSAINQVPETAELWCDVRYNPVENSSVIINEISESFRQCHIEVVVNESPIKCGRESLIFLSLARSLKANQVNPLTLFDHGTSDARHGTKLGISSIVFGPKGGGLHSDSEWVSLKSLRKVESILDHWINNI